MFFYKYAYLLTWSFYGCGMTSIRAKMTRAYCSVLSLPHSSFCSFSIANNFWTDWASNSKLLQQSYSITYLLLFPKFGLDQTKYRLIPTLSSYIFCSFSVDHNFLTDYARTMKQVASTIKHQKLTVPRISWWSDTN